jgi:hypothetical protein
MNTGQHLTSRLNRILQNGHFVVNECSNSVRCYAGISSDDDPHKLYGSMNASQERVRPRAGKDSVSISYNAMISMYPRVSQIYTPCC